MAKKDKYFLELYKLYLHEGELDAMGLCSCVKEGYFSSILEKFTPYYHLSKAFWGHGGRKSVPFIEQAYTFTPLRQTILLFCAAINNEL